MRALNEKAYRCERIGIIVVNNIISNYFHLLESCFGEKGRAVAKAGASCNMSLLSRLDDNLLIPEITL